MLLAAPPSNRATTSLQEVVLRAAARFGAGGVLRSLLVITAWMADKARFGMPGYPNYPDSYKVISCLYGKSGLIHRGLLRKQGDRLYITPDGIRSLS
jgi:hypothetical protein